MRNKVVDEDLKIIVSDDLPWDIFRGSTVLVTGAAGILPSYMVETLLYLNEKNDFKIKVLALVRNLQKAKNRFRNYADRKDLIFIKHDISLPFHFDDNINYIIHAAGQASPKFYGSDPVGTARGHVIGTDNILRLGVEKGVKSLLYFSSCAVYGTFSEPKYCDEKCIGQVDQMQLRSCYSEGKRMAENFCIDYFYQYKLPVKIIRIAHTYGPEMPLDDGRVFADFVANIVNQENISLNSDGSAVRPLLYITDAIRAYFRVLLIGKNGEAYNIASKHYISVLDLAKLLTNIYPDMKLKVVHNKAIKNGYIKPLGKENKFDSKKVQDLGWKQQFDIQEGFKRTINSYLLDQNRIK